MQKLHTDLLEEKYGKVSAQIIEQGTNYRIVDIIDQKGISRTRAITVFSNTIKLRVLEKIYKEIRKGGLIGQTIVKNGGKLNKECVRCGQIELPIWLKVRFHTSVDRTFYMIYNLVVIFDNSSELFGTIYEIYPPDFEISCLNSMSNKNSQKKYDFLMNYLSNKQQIALYE